VDELYKNTVKETALKKTIQRLEDRDITNTTSTGRIIMKNNNKGENNEYKHIKVYSNIKTKSNSILLELEIYDLEDAAKKNHRNKKHCKEHTQCREVKN
jgi:hypothetical protein